MLAGTYHLPYPPLLRSLGGLASKIRHLRLLVVNAFSHCDDHVGCSGGVALGVDGRPPGIDFVLVCSGEQI